MDRRRFVAGATGLAAAGALSPLLAAAPARAEVKFQLFDAMRFVGKPDNLVACGLTPIRVVYAYEFWPSRNWDEPNLDHIETTLVPKLLSEGHDRIVLDIEHWEGDEVDKFVQIIEHMRKLMPKVRLGYYSMVPVRDYWAFQPGREGRLIVYRQKVQQWQKLAEAVDDLYPTLYAYYKDRDGWMRMADGMLAAGQAIGKPMYPFLWPQYHDHNRKLELALIEGDFWLQQLDKVKDSGCDGAVLWGTIAPERKTPDGKRARLKWDPTAEWWLQTRAFAQDAGLADSTCT
ncbi:MAG TPA: hypothetical protein VNS22_19645 [Geminicoccus sp.]|uniref:hypothetical protein n=1 Tax=Geminicoccus sp. TaxID=2024832 RepID=UPI002C812A72|nr:hypothetical protein [Geminicoccus sp.]HWL70572.1 hypothetical protein [Geminicoccus sp.]